MNPIDMTNFLHIDEALPQIPRDVNKMIFDYLVDPFEFKIEFDETMLDLLQIASHGCIKPSQYKYFVDEREWQFYLRESNRQDEMLIWDETITDLAFDDWIAQREL